MKPENSNDKPETMPASRSSDLLDAHQRINQTSGKTEYYTPQRIVEAARETLGGIDLDPASSEAANLRVKAATIYTAADDGLAKIWRGRVWMNHPFGRKENPLWINKLIAAYLSRDVTAACCICFASTSEEWFQPLAQYPQCYLSPRTNYIDGVTGKTKRGVSKGSVVTYFGNNLELFAAKFRALGAVKRCT